MKQKRISGLKSLLNKDNIVNRLQCLDDDTRFTSLRKSFTTSAGFVAKNNPFLLNSPDEMDLKAEIIEIYDVIKRVKCAMFVPKIHYLQT